ncbi:MAG: type II secretion system F family protein, partial [Anaerolineae bacterium]
MSVLSTGWLVILATVLVCGGVSAAVFHGLLSSGGPVTGRVVQYEKHLRGEIGFLHLPLSARSVWVAQAAVGAALLLEALVMRQWWVPLLLLPVAAGPALWLRQERDRRIGRVEKQLDQWLLVLANALKASGSLGEALESSASHLRAPLGQEVDRVLKEFRLGTPQDQAKENMNRRLGSR